MQDKRFDQPVHVALGPSGGIVYRVDRIGQAVAILLHRWPTEITKKHTTAQRSNLMALRGAVMVEDARRTFEDAAAEAGILMSPLAKRIIASSISDASISPWPRAR